MDRARRTPERRGGRQTKPSRIDDSRLRLAGLMVLCVKVAVVPLAFDHDADESFVLPKALLSHGLTYVLVGVLVGLVILNGTPALLRSRIQVPVLAYLGVSVLATTFAVNPTLALFGTHNRMLGLATIADGVITFLATVELVRTRREVIAVVLSILAASIVVVAYEFVQLSGHDPLSWSIDGSQRPFSTIGQPTTLGQYLLTLSVVSFAFGVLTPGLRRLLRGALIAYSAGLLFAAGLTGTRSAVIGAAAAVLAFVVLVSLKHPSAKARRLGILCGLGAAVVLGAILVLTPVGGRLLTTVEIRATSDEAALGELEQSASERVAIYRIALAELQERPILGYGPDGFAVGMPTYRPQPAPPVFRQSITTSPHSWVAAVATGSGFAGLLVFIAILVTAASEVFQRPYSAVGTTGALAVVAYLVAAVTTVGAIATEAQFWLAIAAIAGASAGARTPAAAGATHEHTRGRTRSSSISQRVGVWSIVIVSMLMLATQFTALAASRLAHESVGMRTQSTMTVAIDLASRATRWDPNRAQYWEQLALAYAGASRWTDASNAFQNAARVEPHDIRFVTDDIQVQLVLASKGDGQALSRAAELADRVVRTDPGNPSAHLIRARVAQARSDPAAAARSIDRALALDPGSTNGLLYLAATEIYLAAGGRIDDAIRVGQAGVENLPGSEPIRVALARALQAGGRSAEALVQIDAALAIRPDDPAALQLRSVIKASLP